MLQSHALALSDSQSVHKNKSLVRFYTRKHSGGLELMQLTCRHEDDLPHHRGYIAVATTGWPLRVPATNGYPPIFGGRTLPYPPGIAILTGTRVPGYTVTRRVPGGYPDNLDNCSRFSGTTSVDRVEKHAYYWSSTQKRFSTKRFVFRFDTQAA